MFIFDFLVQSAVCDSEIRNLTITLTSRSKLRGGRRFFSSFVDHSSVSTIPRGPVSRRLISDGPFFRVPFSEYQEIVYTHGRSTELPKLRIRLKI